MAEKTGELVPSMIPAMCSLFKAFTSLAGQAVGGIGFLVFMKQSSTSIIDFLAWIGPASDKQDDKNKDDKESMLEKSLRHAKTVSTNTFWTMGIMALGLGLKLGGEKLGDWVFNVFGKK